MKRWAKTVVAKLLFKLYNFCDPTWEGWGEVPGCGEHGEGRLEFLRNSVIWLQQAETRGFFIALETRYKRTQGVILDMQKHPDRHDHLLELIGQAKALNWILEYPERVNEEGARLASALTADAPREGEPGGN